jgi:hypothetical protein
MVHLYQEPCIEESSGLLRKAQGTEEGTSLVPDMHRAQLHSPLSAAAWWEGSSLGEEVLLAVQTERGGSWVGGRKLSWPQSSPLSLA